MSRKIPLTASERRAAEKRRIVSVIEANARRTLDPVWRANSAAAKKRDAANLNSKWSRAMRRTWRSRKFRAAASRGQLIRWARVRRERWHAQADA
jgi:hypothetical protein